MLIIHNARIKTLDPAQPTATAIAIKSGRVIAVGSDGDVLNLADRRAQTIDLGGKTVLPGLIDAHLHLMHLGLSLDYVDCETPTKAETLRRVNQHYEASNDDGWIRGHGWNQNDWADGFGTADELEQAAPGRPVYLTAKSLHAAWANRTALKLAGITRDTPDPQDGVIVRSADGEPTGILLESAMELVEQAIPEPTPEERIERIDAAQKALWRYGITGVHDYDQADCFTALQKLEAEDRLRLRVVKGIPLGNLPHAAALGLRSGFGSERLRIGSVKLFADGALGPQTAAMLQPYEGSQDTGVLLLDAEAIFEHGQTAVRNGLSLAVHAIGDRANHEVLNGFEQLRRFERSESLPALRHRIEHVQVIHPSDLPRLAELNVIASMQPIHATSDMFTADRYWGARSAFAYAFRSLLESGARLAFGSDAPVESPNPFLGLHAAVTRCRPTGQPGPDGWFPEQRLTLEQALSAYTTGAAYAAGWEARQGRLSPGCFADLIVLRVDPFSIPPHEIHTLSPEAAMIAGEWVWQA